MENMQALAQTFRRTLQLKTGPVAVRIIKNHDEIPILFKKPETPMPSFCHGVMEAFKGKGFFLGRADVQCSTGLTALGFRKEVTTGGKRKHPPRPMGPFRNAEAARNYFSKGICLPAGQTKGVVMSPLDKAVMGVDVVLFKVNPEQTMWLLAATQYLSGGRNDLCLGTGYQGVCGDVIAYPVVTQRVNITVNGVSDRVLALKTKRKNDIVVGVPDFLLKKIAFNLLELLSKPALKPLHSPRCLHKFGF